MYNVGTGIEFSIQEVIDAIEKITKASVSMKIIPVDKRPTSLIVNSRKLFDEYGWTPKNNFELGIKNMYEDLKAKS